MGDRLGTLGAVGVSSFLHGLCRKCACESQQQRAGQSKNIVLHKSNPRFITQFCTFWPFHQPRKVAVYVSLSQCLSSPLFHGGSSVRFNIKISCIAECSAVIQLCQSTLLHLKSFTHSRINLSPLLKISVCERHKLSIITISLSFLHGSTNPHKQQQGLV